MGETTDRPGKPVKMSSLWYLEGSVPKGGILSQRRQVRRYLGIRKEGFGGVEGIVLRKDGDVGRCGEGGEMVAV